MIMNINTFEKVQQKRNQMKVFAKVALDKNWIEEDEYDNIVKKIDSDILTIGVIGQMKCGKSTFLNAFLFEDDILPAATTPMTAALSVITYGEEKSIEVEFYNKNEWLEIQTQAQRDISEANGDKGIESKIKAAKELVDKSSKIRNEINSLLGSTKRDSFEKLIEYVGADGKYVALTKSVTIYYPKEWLKGVKVVDTPGFNDPVVSREERTQDFLKQADVVLMLVYAGRAFDATDRDIVFEKVRSVGIGKILIGINKYDIQYGQGESIEEISNNVKEEIKKACREYGDNTINDLLKNLEPIPFSANMALMAKKPIEKIRNDDDLMFHWKKACDDFEISTQKQMLEKSLINKLEEAIRETIEKSKEEILFRKPINQILQGGNKIKDRIDSELADKNEVYKGLSIPDDELDDRIRDLERAQKRIKGKIEDCIVELGEEYDKAIKKSIREWEDLVASSRANALKTIDEASSFSSEKVQRNVERILKELRETKIPRKIEDFSEGLKDFLIDKAMILQEDIEEILQRRVKDHYDILDEFKRIIKGITAESIENDFFVEKNSDDNIGLLDIVLAIPILPVIGIYEGIIGWKNTLRENVNNYIESINFSEVKSRIGEIKKVYINKFDSKAMEGVMTHIINQLEGCKGDKIQKQEKLQKIDAELRTLKKDKEKIEEDIKEMTRLKNDMSL